MGNFLNSISLFIARRADAEPQAAPLLPQTDGSSAIQASDRSTGGSRPDTGEHQEVSRADGAQDTSDRLLPLVAYPIRREEPAPPKGRQSRALNLLRSTSTSVAMTSHAMPTTPSSSARRHESHRGRLVLTETEKVRLQVMQVQLRLASLSLYEGPIDGTLNPETVTGVRHFQTLKGMRDTGTLTAGTLSALGVPPIG